MAVLADPRGLDPPPADRFFEELFGRHRHALARYCGSLVDDEHDARDVLQNVAVQVLVALRRGNRPRRERAWLYRIARNEAVTLFRARRRAEQIDESLADPLADPSRTIIIREQLGELADDIRALTPQARRVLLMSSVGELGRNEISAELGLSPGAVSQSLSEAQAALRADRAARELPCEQIRSILSAGDGRHRHTRAVRAHLRGCPGCREWVAGHRKRSGIAAILPAPIAAFVRWIQPLAGTDPGSAMLAARPGAVGASRALGVIVSLAAGTAGIVAGVPGPNGSPGRARLSQSRTSEARATGVTGRPRVAAARESPPVVPVQQVATARAAASRPALVATRTVRSSQTATVRPTARSRSGPVRGDEYTPAGPSDGYEDRRGAPSPKQQSSTAGPSQPGADSGGWGSVPGSGTPPASAPAPATFSARQPGDTGRGGGPAVGRR